MRQILDTVRCAAPGGDATHGVLRPESGLFTQDQGGAVEWRPRAVTFLDISFLIISQFYHGVLLLTHALV